MGRMTHYELQLAGALHEQNRTFGRGWVLGVCWRFVWADTCSAAAMRYRFGRSHLLQYAPGMTTTDYIISVLVIVFVVAVVPECLFIAFGLGSSFEEVSYL